MKNVLGLYISLMGLDIGYYAYKYFVLKWDKGQICEGLIPVGTLTLAHRIFEVLNNSYIIHLSIVLVVINIASKVDIFQSLSKLDDVIKISIF